MCSSTHPCPENWVAIGRVVVYYARAAHAFSAGIISRYCKDRTNISIRPVLNSLQSRCFIPQFIKKENVYSINKQASQRTSTVWGIISNSPHNVVTLFRGKYEKGLERATSYASCAISRRVQGEASLFMIREYSADCLLWRGAYKHS